MAGGDPTGRPGARPRRVLLVDDEPALVCLLSRILELMGYSVDSYDDPVQAVRAFTDDPRRFDALVVDLGMPVLDGEAVIRAAREARPGVPAVLVTDHAVEKKAGQPGLRVIPKPFLRGELERALEAVLSEE